MFGDIIMSINDIDLFNFIAHYITISIVVIFSCVLLFSVLKVLLYHKPRMKNIVKKIYKRGN